MGMQFSKRNFDRVGNMKIIKLETHYFKVLHYKRLEEITTSRDILRCLKTAIDTFMNLYFRKINFTPLYQMYVQKISD